MHSLLIAEEITMMVHSKEDLRKVQKATEILFGKSTTDDLKKIDRQIFLDVFEGVPKVQILKKEIKSGVDIISALVSIGNFLSSKGEARRAIRENSISVNKNKVDEILGRSGCGGRHYFDFQDGQWQPLGSPVFQCRNAR